jgi:replicative DNA helicase
MFSNESLEKQIIAYLLKDVKFVGISEMVLKPEFFSGEKYRRMYKFISGFYKKYQTVLDYEWFKNKLKKVKLPAEEENDFLLLFKECKGTELDDEKFSYAIDQLKDLTMKRGVRALVDKYGKVLKDDEFDEGEKLVDQLNEDIHNLRIDANLLTISRQFVYEDVDTRINEYDVRKKLGDVPGIPFGWKTLDGLTGGYFRQELITIFSRTGGGKTRALHNIAYNATTKKRKGLFITIEMSVKEICRLYDARLTRLHYADIKKGRLDANGELKWKGLIRMMEEQQLQKGFCVVDVPEGCTTDTVLQEIVEYERKNGKLDFVVIDYLLLMESVNKKSGNKNDIVGDIAKDLKRIARRKDVAIITATQANREALKIEEQGNVGSEHIAMSDQIAHHSNIILYLWRSQQDKLKNKLQVNLVKCRDGAGVSFELYADWARNYIGDEIWQLENDIKTTIQEQSNS